MAAFSEKDYRDYLVPKEGLNLDEYCVVSYRILARDPAVGDAEIAIELALNTSLGSTNCLPFECPITRKDLAAKVLDCYKSPTGQIILDIAFPAQLCGRNEGVAQLLALCSYASEFSTVSRIWIDNIQLPRSVISRYSGPHLGVAGIRQRLGVYGRPLLGVIVKPRLGSLANSHLFDALVGGADILIDDELIVDPDGPCGLASRIEILSNQKKRAEQKTGKKKFLVANISASPSRCRAYFDIAAQHEADGVLVNSFSMGLAGVQEICEYAKGNLAVFDCGIGLGLFTRPPFETGISDKVFAYLSRLCGADAFYTGVPGEHLWYTRQLLRKTVAITSQRLYDLRTSFAVGAGGLNPANIWLGAHCLGPDVILLAGTGILGYPNGCDRAAQAMHRILTEVSWDLHPEDATTHVSRLAKQDKGLRQILQHYGFKSFTGIEQQSNGH